jgi:predicted HicB family RNase H-like nuclease
MKYLMVYEDEIHKKIKVRAAQTGTTIKAFIIKALEDALEKTEPKEEKKK